LDQEFPTVWEKMSENLRGGDFFLTHTVDHKNCYFVVWLLMFQVSPDGATV